MKIPVIAVDPHPDATYAWSKRLAVAFVAEGEIKDKYIAMPLMACEKA